MVGVQGFGKLWFRVCSSGLRALAYEFRVCKGDLIHSPHVPRSSSGLVSVVQRTLWRVV